MNPAFGRVGKPRPGGSSVERTTKNMRLKRLEFDVISNVSVTKELAQKRFDERLDFCHFCDHVMPRVELRICPDSSLLILVSDRDSQALISRDKGYATVSFKKRLKLSFGL